MTTDCFLHFDLFAVIIAPHLRKSGLGRKLLEMTEGYVRNKGYISMCLSSVFNGAEKFYEKCGFYESEPAQPAKQERLNAKIEMVNKIGHVFKYCQLLNFFGTGM